MRDQWVDVTNFMRDKEPKHGLYIMAPAENQAWHVGAAVFKKSLRTFDTADEYRDWINQVTEDLGNPVVIDPEIQQTFNGQLKWVGYDLSLSSYANMVFKTHSKTTKDGLLLSDVRLEVFKPASSGELVLTRTNNTVFDTELADSEKTSDLEGRVRLEDESAIGADLMPIFDSMSVALASRTTDAVKMLRDIIPPTEEMGFHDFMNDQSAITRSEFLGLNAYLAQSAQHWIREELDPQDQNKLSKTVSAEHQAPIWETYAQAPHTTFWVSRVTQNTGPRPQGLS